MKTIVCEVKNILDGINEKLNTAEENITELEGIAIKIMKNETEIKENFKK